MADNKEVEKILDIHVNYADALKGIQKYKEELERLKAVEKELDKNSEGYEEELELISAKRREAQAEIRGLRKEIQNNIKQEKAQEGSLKQLRAALSNLTAEYDRLGNAEEKDRKRKEQLVKEISDLTDEIKSQEEATQRYYRNVGNYKNSILEAIGLNGGFGSSLVEMAENGKGVGGFFANVTTNVKAFGTALLGLLSNPVFLAIAGIAGAGVAFKWWYDYNKGLMEATRLTKQLNQEMEGEALKIYRNEVQALADLYEKDFVEVLRTANTLVQQFGVTAPEALNLIRTGLELGADINGEFLDGIREYSTHFREAGVSAQEFIAISVNASKTGVFGDKGLDAIKEALLRIREMPQATREAIEGLGLSVDGLQKEISEGTSSVFEVIQRITKAIKDAGATSEVTGKAFADIFGGAGEDAGYQYLSMLSEMETNLDELIKQQEEWQRTQDEIYQSEVRLQNALSGLFDETGGSFERLKAGWTVFFNDYIAGMLTVINYIVDFITWGEKWRTIFVNLTFTARAFFSGIVEWASKASNVIASFGQVLASSVTFSSEKMEESTANLSKAMQDAKDVFGKTWKEIQDIWESAEEGQVTSSSMGNTSIVSKPTAPKTPTSTKNPLKNEVKARYEAMKDEISKEAELIRKRLELVKMEAEERYRIKMELLEKERQLDIMRITEEYTNEEQRREALELLTIEYDQKEQAIRKEKSDAIWADVTAQGEAMLDAVIKSEDAVTKTREKYAEEQKKIEQDKVKALTLLTGSLSDLAFEAAEDNEALAGVAKGLAIANILIAQGEAIANAVKTATRSSSSWWEIAGAIGTVVATVTSVMRTAMKSVNSAKVGGSRGGGGGASMGGYSSSAVFNPLLSSFNSFGQNIQTYGGQTNRGEMMSEEMMADAVSRGVLTSPAPVVSVVEITEAQRRVKIIEETDAV